jgi:7-carboxy-7-deazaguanine synthase
MESVDDIVRWAQDAGPKHVVLTGGEPLLPMKVVELCDKIRAAGLHLTIETAGTVFRPISCDLLSLSPKTSRSTPSPQQFPNHHPVMAQRMIEAHQRRRWQPDVIARLIACAADFQIKFVLDTPDETDEIEAAVQQLGLDRESIWIMPQASDPQMLDKQCDWIRGWCETTGYNFCDRAHLRWYGAVRGT